MSPSHNILHLTHNPVSLLYYTLSSNQHKRKAQRTVHTHVSPGHLCGIHNYNIICFILKIPLYPVPQKTMYLHTYIKLVTKEFICGYINHNDVEKLLLLNVGTTDCYWSEPLCPGRVRMHDAVQLTDRPAAANAACSASTREEGCQQDDQ